MENEGSAESVVSEMLTLRLNLLNDELGGEKACFKMQSKVQNLHFGRNGTFAGRQCQSQSNPKEIAVHIGKSERTVKTLTIGLTECGIIARKNEKRNGYWEIYV